MPLRSLGNVNGASGREPRGHRACGGLRGTPTGSVGLALLGHHHPSVQVRVHRLSFAELFIVTAIAFLLLAQSAQALRFAALALLLLRQEHIGHGGGRRGLRAASVRQPGGPNMGGGLPEPVWPEASRQQENPCCRPSTSGAAIAP